MKRVSAFLVLAAVFGCSSILYRGWQYVRIEKSLPDASCEYRVQEVCPPMALEGCLNWYKKRATRYDANTVVLGEDRMAEYYHCEFPQLQPPKKSAVPPNAM